jgi:hypothetical protein
LSHAGDHVTVQAASVEGDEPVKVIAAVALVVPEEFNELVVEARSDRLTTIKLALIGIGRCMIGATVLGPAQDQRVRSR